MRLGSFVTLPTSWPFENSPVAGPDTQLYGVALQWLKEDRDFRRELEKKGRKVRGARKDDVGSFVLPVSSMCLISCARGRCPSTRKHSTRSAFVCTRWENLLIVSFTQVRLQPLTHGCRTKPTERAILVPSFSSSESPPDNSRRPHLILFNTLLSELLAYHSTVLPGKRILFRLPCIALSCITSCCSTHVD